MYFTIITNKDVAEKIKKQCEWDEKFNSGRSFLLGKITHDIGFSEVQIKAKDGLQIKPSDIFWLGHFFGKSLTVNICSNLRVVLKTIRNLNHMEYKQALEIAEKAKALLFPHCERIEIAGSIRRKKPDVKDIEIVAIPKPYDIGLFASGIATVVNQWHKVKGELPCKYTQRILPEGIKLDLFFAERDNWGLIYAIRTGSADYSHKVLATGWVKRGYKSEGGYIVDNGKQIVIPEEEDLFKLIGVPFIAPELRSF